MCRFRHKRKVVGPVLLDLFWVNQEDGLFWEGLFRDGLFGTDCFGLGRTGRMLGLTWLGVDWLEWTDFEWTDLGWTVLSVVVEHVGGCRPGFWKFGFGSVRKLGRQVAI